MPLFHHQGNQKKKIKKIIHLYCLGMALVMADLPIIQFPYPSASLSRAH